MFHPVFLLDRNRREVLRYLTGNTVETARIYGGKV